MVNPSVLMRLRSIVAAIAVGRLVSRLVVASVTTRLVSRLVAAAVAV